MPLKGFRRGYGSSEIEVALVAAHVLAGGESNDRDPDLLGHGPVECGMPSAHPARVQVTGCPVVLDPLSDPLRRGMGASGTVFAAEEP